MICDLPPVTPFNAPAYDTPSKEKGTDIVDPNDMDPIDDKFMVWCWRHLQHSPIGEKAQKLNVTFCILKMHVFSACGGQLSEGFSYKVLHQL